MTNQNSSTTDEVCRVDDVASNVHEAPEIPDFIISSPIIQMALAEITERPRMFMWAGISNRPSCQHGQSKLR